MAEPHRHSDYHHGDLRSALIDAAIDLVQEEGVGALSLRALARRARVSHSAPYHHFRSKADLLAEVAAAGFDRLVKTIESEFQKYAADDHLGRLVAVGAGYLYFALQNASLFRLMFRPEMTSPEDHPGLRAAESRAFATLHDTLVACQVHGKVSSDSVLSMCMSCWATMHGLCMLWIDQVVKETPLREVPFDGLAQEVQERLVASVTLKMAKTP